MLSYYLLTGGKLVASVSRATNKPIYGLSTTQRAQILIKSDHYPSFEEVNHQLRGTLNNADIDGIYSIKPITETCVEHIFTRAEMENCTVLQL